MTVANQPPEPPSQPSAVHVLVVGDEIRLGAAAEALRDLGCSVGFVTDHNKVPDTCATNWPDAVVLEIDAGGRGAAIETLDWLRTAANVPVVAITEPDDVDARLRCVSLHADDTVAPVAPREIVGRVAALMKTQRERQRLARPYGDILVDRSGRRLLRRGSTVVLTEREMQVFEALASQPGRIMSKRDLLERVWGSTDASANALEAQISALRRKVHSIGPPVIHTAHGEGYVFRPTVAIDNRQRARLIAERERLVREREEAVARRAKLLRQMEDQLGHRAGLLPKPD